MNALFFDTLALLKAAGTYGLTLDDLLRRLRAGAHRVIAVPELETALRDLTDRSWLAPFESPLSGKRWRLTALGDSALKEEGL